MLDISPGRVCVVFTDPDAAKPSDAILDESERAYVASCGHPRRRREFQVARTLLRRTLSRCAGRAPEDWRFVTGAHGRPELSPDIEAPGLSFNLSHTRGLVAVVVCSGAEVGVDVEDTQRRGRTVELADRWFSPAEVAALRRLPESRWRERFFDLWTLKESYIKARGLGLAIPLQRFGFDLDGRGIGFHVDPSLGDPAARWRFWLLSPTPTHRAAVAVERTGRMRLTVEWV